MGRLRGETIGERIVEARKAAGMNRSQLVRRLEVAYTTVFNWETGASTPETENVVKVAEATGFSFADLVGQTETIPAERGTPNIEAAIERRERDLGRALSDYVKQRVRRYAATGADFSPHMAESLINEAIAEEMGRAVERPDAGAQVDEAAGQVHAKPKKRRARAED